MILGNDVVDLLDRETDPQVRHPRFDRRVFAADELADLETSATPNLLRWALWAAKESAYKALRRMDPRTVFSPVCFGVELDWQSGAQGFPASGRVRYEGRRLRVRLELIHGGVHAVATSAGVWPSLMRGVDWRKDGESPSAAVRRLARTMLASRFGVTPDEVTFGRHDRAPVASWRGHPAPVDVSFSHHGRLVAAVCSLSAQE